MPQCKLPATLQHRFHSITSSSPNDHPPIAAGSVADTIVFALQHPKQWVDSAGGLHITRSRPPYSSGEQGAPPIGRQPLGGGRSARTPNAPSIDQLRQFEPAALRHPSPVCRSRPCAFVDPPLLCV